MFRLLSVSFAVLVLLVLGWLVVWLFGVSEFVSSCRGLLSGLLCRRFLEFWFRAGGGCFAVNSVVLYSSLFSCWLFWWWMIWCFYCGRFLLLGDWLFWFVGVVAYLVALVLVVLVLVIAFWC